MRAAATWATVLLSAVLSVPAMASEPYRRVNLVLLQPDAVLDKRVPDVQALSRYIDAVSHAAKFSLAAEPVPAPAAGFLVVAVRPGGQSKVWLDFTPALPTEMADRLRASAEAVTAVETREGVVVVAINAVLWDATPSQAMTPSPREWRDAVKDAKAPIEIGELVERVWTAPPGG